MRKLSQLKEWLTLEDTAKELSEILSEQVSLADVLRLTLDGHLKLSVNFINKTPANTGTVIPHSEASYKYYEALTDSMSSNNTEVQKVRQLQDEHFSDIEAFKLDGNVKLVIGVWDIVMVAGAKKDVENKFNRLSGGDFLRKYRLDGVFIEKDGEVCQLKQYFNIQSTLSAESFIQMIKDSLPDQQINEDECLKFFESSKLFKEKYAAYRTKRANNINYFPSGIEQDGGVLVVRASSIAEFDSKVKETLIERQKAVSQIKASRTSSDLSIKKLLDNAVVDLTKDNDPEDDFSRYFELYVWKEKLKKEAIRLTIANYDDEGRREDRLELIDKKIEEIDWHLEGCPSENTSKPKTPVKYNDKSTLPSKSAYQVQGLIERWTKLFGEHVTNSDILQWAIDEKYSLFVTNTGLRKVNLHTRTGLGMPSRGITAYLDNKYIKLQDFQMQVLLNGSDMEISILNITESDFVQGDESVNLSDIEMAILNENERISISPDDIKYLSVMGDEVLAFETLHSCLDKEKENYLAGLKDEIGEGQALLAGQEENDSELKAVVPEMVISDGSYSCGTKYNHKMIDRAFYSINKPYGTINKKDVIGVIKKDHELPKGKRQIDTEDKITKIEYGKVYWITEGTDIEKPITSGRLTALVKKLNDNNKS